MAGDSFVHSPWRRALPGVGAGVAMIVIGIGLGIAVSPGYFGIAGLGLAIDIVSVLVALVRAMRPAKNARTGYHWTTFYPRKLGEAGS